MARQRPEGQATFDYADGQVTLTIAGAELGQTIYATYGAAYAAAVEYGSRGRQGRGFVRLAALQWQQVVTEVTAELQGRSAAS